MDSQPHSTIGIRALFGVVYATSISSVYFALGVVAHHANGLTPAVFVVAGVFFLLTGMTYAEGASVHRESGGSAVLARYAFNELVSFLSGWAIVLDYTILVAVAALTAPVYLGVFWPALNHGLGQVLCAIFVIALIAADALRGISGRRLRQRAVITVIDLSLQVAVIVLGVVLVFHPAHLTQSIHLGSAPSAADLAFALPIGVIAFAGIESAANLAGETRATPRQLKGLVGFGGATIVAVYVGIAVIGIATLPVEHGVTALGLHHVNAPLLGIVESYRPDWVADVLKYVVGVLGAVGLTSAAGAAMLGVSRVGFSLATNRQIPSTIGRLSPRFGTPWLVITGAAVAAAGLVIPTNLEVLVGIYAFGALIAFTVAHLSVIVLRFREPDREREFEMPFSVRLRGARVPLPAVAGAALAAGGWIALVIYHHAARYVGLGWMLAGLALYVIYRRSQGKPLLRQVTIPERALRHETPESEFGSILVPLFGTPLDDDIIQTAGRLAGETRDELVEKGATIEAIWVFEIPMSLPLDAPLPDAQVKLARAALQRAKEVGEEYEGVEVMTATTRARRAGQEIVNQAKRRGVEAIILAAEAPSGIRGGGRLGGVGPLENYVGAVTKYVVRKSPVRVILTAPPADWKAKGERPAIDESGDGAQPSEPSRAGVDG